MEEEGWGINGNVSSTTYQSSPIPSGGWGIPLVLQFQSAKCATHCKMKKFLQALYNYRYTEKEADYSDDEPEEEICFSDEEENMNKKSKKKIGDISSSESEEFPMSPRKQKQLIEISDDSVQFSNTRDTRR